MNNYARVSLWLIGLSPLVWIPGAFDRFVFGKLVAVGLAVTLGALAPRQGMLPERVRWIVLIGLGWFTVACLISPTPLASLVGRWPRYEGLPVVGLYAGCAWLGARLLGARSRSVTDELLRVLAISSLILAFFSTCATLGFDVEGGSVESRTGSVLGNATDQGMVGMMLCAALFACALTGRNWLLIAGSAAGALTVVLSASRASLVALLVALALQAMLRRRALLRPFAMTGGGLAVLALALPQVRGRLDNVHTISGRRLLWQETLHLGGERWWSGGPSTFVDEIGKYQDREWARTLGPENPPDSPHAWPLQALASGGVPMLLIAVVLAVAVLVFGWKVVSAARDPLEVGLLGAVVGYGLILSVNFTIAGSTCLAAFLAGVLIAERATKAGEHRWITRGSAALAAAAVLIFGAASIGERFLLDGIRESRQGNLSSAAASFARARSLRPLDPDVAMLAAQSLGALANDEVPGAGKATRTWAGRSLDHTPKTYASNMALAVAESHDHEFTGALARLDRLAKWYPIQPGIYVQRGIVKFALGDLDGAFADLRRATGLDPADPTAGRILQRIKDELGPRAVGR